MYSTIPPESVEGIEGGVASRYNSDIENNRTPEGGTSTEIHPVAASSSRDLMNHRPKRTRYEGHLSASSSAMASQPQYYQEMIQIERRKLQLMEIDHEKRMIYLDRKTEYFNQLLAERRNHGALYHRQPQSNNFANTWTQQWHPPNHE